MFKNDLEPDFSDRLFNLWRAVTRALTFAGWLLVALVFMALLARAAFAQDGGVPPTMAEDPVKAVAGIVEAGSKGQWWAVAAAAVSLLTWMFRTGVLRKLPGPLARPGNWLATNPVASFVTPFALSGVLALLTTFATGTPFMVATFLQEVLKIGAGAVAVFIGVEKIKEAKNAGAMASSGITTQREALDELAKRAIAGGPTVAGPVIVPPPPEPPKT